MKSSQSYRLGTRGKITGNGSQVIKYDVLTALLSLAASGQGTNQRLALRMSLLVTARFSWQRGTFCVGQREMARMWNVTERTAKREIAALRAAGWIAVAVPAARGRVAEYEVILPAIFAATQPCWRSVGPDFEARMLQASSPPAEASTDSNVVPLHQSKPPELEGDIWPAASSYLREQDPTLFNAWFQQLEEVSVDVGVLTLTAPNHFVANYVLTHFKMRLLSAVTVSNRDVRDVRVIAN